MAVTACYVRVRRVKSGYVKAVLVWYGKVWLGQLWLGKAVMAS